MCLQGGNKHQLRCNEGPIVFFFFGGGGGNGAKGEWGKGEILLIITHSYRELLLHFKPFKGLNLKDSCLAPTSERTPCSLLRCEYLVNCNVPENLRFLMKCLSYWQ